MVRIVCVHKNVFLRTQSIDPDWSPVTSVDVMSGVFACPTVIDRCLMTPSVLKDGVTDSIWVCLGQLGGNLYKRVTDRPLSAACP